MQPGFMDNVTAWEQLPPQPAKYGITPSGLDSRLVAAVHSHLGVHSNAPLLYTHQSSAIEAALRGQSVVVVSRTASGKTLCYNLPILNTLLQRPEARALYLFPTKALAQDQATELSAMTEYLPFSTPPSVSTYDGDTPQSQRSTIRREARILITNPDMLHAGILPHHPRWVELLSNLTYVVLDELHTYRGVFGSHVANVLRRLRRICNFHGVSPQFVCTSATIGNPKELAQKLVEEPVALVDNDGSPRAPKHFILYNPPMVDPILGLRRAYTLEASKLANHLIKNDVQTIVFTRTRNTTELLLGYVREQIGHHGDNKHAIRGYRGGYLSAERREIERGLRTGKVRGVVATNALEMGVDIGQLGAVIIAGYPGTVTSLWQQAGRTGRRSEVSAVIFVASGTPLDQYIVLNPHYVFESVSECGLINPDNPSILLSHLRCALFELPFKSDETFGTLEISEQIIGVLAENGEVHLSTDTAHWVGLTYPAADISLRSTSANKVLIKDISKDKPIIIGHVDLETAPLLIHSGAVYVHEAKQYLVDTLNWEIGAAEVHPMETDYYTKASEDTHFTVLRVFETNKTMPARHAHGQILVTTQATHFRKIKRYTHETLDYTDIDVPPHEFETSAYWLWINGETVRRLEAEGLSLSPNNYGPNWLRQRELVRAMAEHRCQHCGDPENRSTTVKEPHQHDVHHVRPFRRFGYIAGENENYREANSLDNLILLCRRCHHRTEASQETPTALGGLSYALTNLAPFHLMCDPNDIRAIAELRGKETGSPTITIFDGIPGGIGLSKRLYEMGSELIEGVRVMTSACPCTHGCPACVGPVVAHKDKSKSPSLKELTIRLAGELS